MHTEYLDLKDQNTNFKLFLATPDVSKSKDKKPAILVAHAFRGQDDFAREQAVNLSKLGYVALACDLYGQGISTESDEEAFKLMMPLFLDRPLLQHRIKLQAEFLSKLPLVDKDRIGAIGFCFGGLSVIELLRSGFLAKGIVSFHGLLGYTIGKHKAQPAKKAEMKGSLLILHGQLDPLVSTQDIADIQEEMTQSKIDWQMNIYGNTMHAFTNPQANFPDQGLKYNPKTASKAFNEMHIFFKELLS